MSNLPVIIMLIFVGANSSAYAQKMVQPRTHKQPAPTQLENFHIQAQSIESFFSRLSLSNNIPVGLEIASNDNEFIVYDLELKRGTVADFLNRFVKAHNQYTWETVDGVINVFPKDSYRDLTIAELLNTPIGSFSIGENTSCFALIDALLATPEVKKYLAASGISQRGLNFSGGYFPQLGRSFTFNDSNMTVKSILNKVAKESPLARMWVTKKYGAEQKFFISLQAFHADAVPAPDFKVTP